MTTVSGEPEVAAAAVPAARLVTPAAAVTASAANPDLISRLLEVLPMTSHPSPEKTCPTPVRPHRHTRCTREAPVRSAATWAKRHAVEPMTTVGEDGTRAQADTIATPAVPGAP